MACMQQCCALHCQHLSARLCGVYLISMCAWSRMRLACNGYWQNEVSGLTCNRALWP
jgi:hypothetical protein